MKINYAQPLPQQTQQPSPQQPYITHSNSPSPAAAVVTSEDILKDSIVDTEGSVKAAKKLRNSSYAEWKKERRSNVFWGRFWGTQFGPGRFYRDNRCFKCGKKQSANSHLESEDSRCQKCHSDLELAIKKYNHYSKTFSELKEGNKICIELQWNSIVNMLKSTPLSDYFPDGHQTDIAQQGLDELYAKQQNFRSNALNRRLTNE